MERKKDKFFLVQKQRTEKEKFIWKVEGLLSQKNVSIKETWYRPRKRKNLNILRKKSKFLKIQINFSINKNKVLLHITTTQQQFTHFLKNSFFQKLKQINSTIILPFFRTFFIFFV